MRNKKKALIITAYHKDYLNYLRMVLKVNPNNNNDYKACIKLSDIRTLLPEEFEECIWLKGRRINFKGQNILFDILEQAEARGFKIKEVSY